MNAIEYSVTNSMSNCPLGNHFLLPMAFWLARLLLWDFFHKAANYNVALGDIGFCSRTFRSNNISCFAQLCPTPALNTSDSVGGGIKKTLIAPVIRKRARVI